MPTTADFDQILINIISQNRHELLPSDIKHAYAQLTAEHALQKLHG